MPGATLTDGDLPTASDGGRGRRLAVMGLVVNAGLAVVKLIGGVVGRSSALLADGTESMADIFGSLVVWGGLRVAAQPADEAYPYGRGKAEPLAAIIVAMLLIGAAVGIAIEAVREIAAPRHAPAAYTVAILLGVVAVKETFFRVVRRAAQRVSSAAVLADAWHHRSDAISSGAAAIGISIALIGGPGYEPADDFAALVAAGVIVFNAYRLMVPSLRELMDAEPTAIVSRAREIAATVPGVAGVEKVFARKSGTRYWVDMHVEVDPAMPVRQAHGVSHDVKDAIRGAMPVVDNVLVHIEPFSEGN